MRSDKRKHKKRNLIPAILSIVVIAALAVGGCQLLEAKNNTGGTDGGQDAAARSQSEANQQSDDADENRPDQQSSGIGNLPAVSTNMS